MIRLLLSTTQAAKKAGYSLRRFQTLLTQGRIAGAQFVGNRWVIPADFEVLPPTKGK
jgi:hypothetical protein